MVSKSKILGKSILIFITVGSTNFQFDRLFKSIDSTLISFDTNLKVILQKGNSHYRWKYKNVEEQSCLSPNKMIALIKKSDKIITHAGPATIFFISKYSKFMPLVVPRLKLYKEHVDDHQYFFSYFMNDKMPKKYKKYFLTERNINDKIRDYLNEKPVLNIINNYLFLNKKNDKLIKLLHRYLSN